MKITFWIGFILFTFTFSSLVTPGVKELLVDLQKFPVKPYIAVTWIVSLMTSVFAVINHRLVKKVSFRYMQELIAFSKGTLVAWVVVLASKIFQ